MITRLFTTLDHFDHPISSFSQHEPRILLQPPLQLLHHPIIFPHRLDMSINTQLTMNPSTLHRSRQTWTL